MPPGFWEEAHEPHPPSREQRRQVRSEPDRQPREQAPATGGVTGGAAGPGVIDDPGFETLQALFPGRIIGIEVADDDPDEEATPTDDANPEEQEA